MDTSGGDQRLAPPSMLVALAAGLGSMDMPIPQVATWEWVSWKFPKPVRAGDTIFARWTLTQKRPPVHGSKTGIAVWRVDVHTTDGAMAAEGEVGASVFRGSHIAERDGAQAAPPAGRRRRRRRTATAPASAEPPAPAKTHASSSERASSSRRRRRRRASGSSTAHDGNGEGGAQAGPPVAQAAATPPAAAAPSSPESSSAPSDANPLSRMMRRLRRT
jgi:hypothetical protein